MTNLNSRLTEILELAGKVDRLACDLSSGKTKWTMSIPPQKDDSDMMVVELSRTLIPQLVEALKLAIEQRDNCIKYLNPATGIDDSVQINLMNERLEPILRRV